VSLVSINNFTTCMRHCQDILINLSFLIHYYHLQQTFSKIYLS